MFSLRANLNPNYTQFLGISLSKDANSESFMGQNIKKFFKMYTNYHKRRPFYFIYNIQGLLNSLWSSPP